MHEEAGIHRHPVRQAVGRLLFTAGYGATVLWFWQVDVYHKHFSEAGLLVFAHNMFRVAFMFYLFWMVHAAGMLLLRLVAPAQMSLSILEGLAVRFFAGTGVWHVLLLLLGYAGLYSRPVMLVVSVPAVALSYPHVRELVLGLHAFRRHHRAAWTSKTVALASIIAALFLAVLMIKGLYPGGGHDYFTHYFHYDRAVIERGDLWPNEVWYHYYYSKGAGLFFLAMLLTDPLAPQLVTFCFYTAQLIVLFLLLRRIAPGSVWPIAATIMFLGLYIYTPGPGNSYSYGGWGDFEKLHELNSALILAIIFLAFNAFERTGPQARSWTAAAISAIIAAVIINNTVAVYLSAIFSVVFLWFLVRGAQARLCLVFAGVAAATVVAISAVNYLTTGLVSDHDIQLFWPIADVEKLYRWGVLPLAILKYLYEMGAVADEKGAFFALKLLLKTMRLDMLGPLVAGGLIVAFFAVRGRRWKLAAPNVALALAVAAAVAMALAISVGRREPISFYRYTSFMLPIMLLLGVQMCALAGLTADGKGGCLEQTPRTITVLVFGCFLSALISYHPRRAPVDAVIDATGFAVGVYSIDKAYTTQKGWPARPRYGAIYPGARGAYEAVGPKTRIWSMHTFSYCMLPDCRMESWPSYAMTPDWDRLMFGSAEEGRAALQNAQLDYFLFSAELYLEDPLPLSPLFAPDNIAHYLGLRWTDGTTSLLAWLGPGVTPLDDAWVAKYRRVVAESPAMQNFPLEPLRAIYARLRATPHPWKSFPLR